MSETDGYDAPDSAAGDSGAGDSGAETADPGNPAAAREFGGLYGEGDGVSRRGRLEFDRVVFFSDAVFAIAITLLIVDLPGKTLRAGGRGILGFAISFLVIGLFWMAHHGLFRFITGVDSALMRLNLLFLGIIAFMPYPTKLLTSSGESQASTVIFYAACVSVAGFAEGAIWMYATRPGSGLSVPVPLGVRRLWLLRALAVPVVFLVSMPIAVLSPAAAQYAWILLWPVNALSQHLARRGVLARHGNARPQTGGRAA